MELHRITPLVLCAAVCTFTTLFSSTTRAEFKPTTPAKSRVALPAEVRDTMPSGATSLHFGRLLTSSKGDPMLVHIWTAARKKDSNDERHAFRPSPFCVDLFEAGDKQGTWRYATSAVYLGDNKPREVEVRWLQPNKKQGPVLVLLTLAYLHSFYTVITFPNFGTDEWEEFGAVQKFYQGGIGGGKSTYNFGIDKRGYMTAENELWVNGKKQPTTVYAWNGREYAAPATKEPATEE